MADQEVPRERAAEDMGTSCAVFSLNGAADMQL